MSQGDRRREQLFRASRVRLRAAGVPVAVRRRILARLGGILRIGHARQEELLREAPREVRVDSLYEALFEEAARQDSLDELDMVLRLGAEEALGVRIREHGERVAALLRVPQRPPAEQRPVEGSGELHSLGAQEGPLLLGTEHGPSTRCPACARFVPLGEELGHRETRSGVLSRHRLHCPSCWARGEIERYYSFRLRGNRDRVDLSFPGVLGPLADREWSRRGGLLLLGTGLPLGFMGLPWEPPLLVGILWLLRSQDLGPGWELASALLGLAAALAGAIQAPHPLWGAALAATAVTLMHVLWVLVRRPPGWVGRP